MVIFLKSRSGRFQNQRINRTASNILSPIFAVARGFSGMITRKEKEITSMLEIERYRISSRAWINFLQIFTGT